MRDEHFDTLKPLLRLPFSVTVLLVWHDVIAFVSALKGIPDTFRKQPDRLEAERGFTTYIFELGGLQAMRGIHRAHLGKGAAAPVASPFSEWSEDHYQFPVC